MEVHDKWKDKLVIDNKVMMPHVLSYLGSAILAFDACLYFFASLGETDERFKVLDALVKKNNGLCSAEAGKNC